MMCSVVFLGLEGAAKKVTEVVAPVAILKENGLTATENAIVAILLGLLCPMFYAGKAFIIRKYLRDYPVWDCGIDSLFMEHLCYCIMFAFYHTDHPFILKEVLYGCLISVLFVIGKQTLTIAYARGPGGPVNTIIITQSLY